MSSPAATPPIIVLLTRLDCETDAVLDIFLGQGKVATPIQLDGMLYFDLGMHGGNRVLHTTTIGSDIAWQQMGESATSWVPCAVITIGLAGSLDKSNLQIGDVLVARQVQRFSWVYDHEGNIFCPSPETFTGPTLLLHRLAMLIQMRRRGADSHWPKVQFGLTLFTNKAPPDGLNFDWMLSHHPGALGFTMEGMGLYRTAEKVQIDCMDVRGINEYANPDQTDAEARRKLAAANAAKVVFMAITDGKLFSIPEADLPATHLPAPVQPSATAPTDFFPTVPVSLASLHLTGVRKYADLALAFTPNPAQAIPRGQWIVVLGENGVGKTTLLRSVALALRNVAKRDIWPQYAFSDWANLNQPDGPSPQITIGVIGRSYCVSLPASGLVQQEPLLHGNSLFPLFAYGCRRGSALGDASRAVDFANGKEIATLFEENAGVLHAETWIKEIDGNAAKSTEGKALFEAVIGALKALLQVEDVFVKDLTVWVKESGKQAVPFRFLSDAYLTTAGWFLDLLARWLHMAAQAGMAMAPDFMAHMRGLVLIDEIDLHLHPRLQIDIIPRTKELLPQMSFVVTTHNALTLLGAEPHEIHILREKDGRISAESGIEDPQTLTPAQILQSYFGIEDYHPSAYGQALARYTFLSTYAMRSDDEQAELYRLHDQLTAAGKLPPWDIVPRDVFDPAAEELVDDSDS